MSEKYCVDAEFEVSEDEHGHYWYGHAEGDKNSTELDAGEPLKLDPNHFAVGYTIKGFEPGGCVGCGQVDEGQTGEYPCPICGLPQLWDGESNSGNRG